MASATARRLIEPEMIIALLIAFLIARGASVTLTWLLFPAVRASRRHAWRMVTRLLLIHVVTLALAFGLQLTPVGYLIVTAVGYLLTAVSRQDMIGDSSGIGFALTMTVVLPFYLTKHYVLNFPDREVLAPLPEMRPTAASPEPSSTVGVVTTTLRPTGQARFGSQIFDARTASGQYIDKGESVKLLKTRDGKLLVTPVSQSSAPSAIEPTA